MGGNSDDSLLALLEEKFEMQREILRKFSFNFHELMERSFQERKSFPRISIWILEQPESFPHDELKTRELRVFNFPIIQ